MTLKNQVEKTIQDGAGVRALLSELRSCRGEIINQRLSFQNQLKVAASLRLQDKLFISAVSFIVGAMIGFILG